MKVGVFVALIILPATLYTVICSLAKISIPKKNTYKYLIYIESFNMNIIAL